MEVRLAIAVAIVIPRTTRRDRTFLVVVVLHGRLYLRMACSPVSTSALRTVFVLTVLLLCRELEDLHLERQRGPSSCNAHRHARAAAHQASCTWATHLHGRRAARARLGLRPPLVIIDP